METLELKVANVKCNGCAANIKNGLTEMDQVDAVEVDVAAGKVTVRGESLTQATIAGKLAELGYPVQ